MRARAYRATLELAFSARHDSVKDDLDAVEFALMQRAALAVSHYVVIEDSRLDFGRVDDRWYLLAVDVLDEPCG